MAAAMGATGSACQKKTADILHAHVHSLRLAPSSYVMSFAESTNLQKL